MLMQRCDPDWKSRQGVTLVELMVASGIAMVVVLGVGGLEVARIRMAQEARRSSSVGAQQQRNLAAIAALRLAQDLERADRVVILNTGISGLAPYTGPAGQGNIQIRIPDISVDSASCTGCATAVPPPCCLQIAGNYRWVQHKRIDGTDQLLAYAPPDCAGSAEIRVRNNITSLTFQYVDQAAPPPGGDACDVRDENLIQYNLRWDNGVQSQTFRGIVAIRGGAYTDVNATCGDSGAGLPAAPALSPPPPAC